MKSPIQALASLKLTPFDSAIRKARKVDEMVAKHPRIKTLLEPFLFLLNLAIKQHNSGASLTIGRLTIS